MRQLLIVALAVTLLLLVAAAGCVERPPHIGPNLTPAPPATGKVVFITPGALPPTPAPFPQTNPFIEI